MSVSLRKLIVCLAALIVAVASVAFISQNPGRIGYEPLIIRAALLSLAIVSALVAAYPFNPLFAEKPGIYALAVCLPAVLPVLVYYFFLLPNQAGVGLSAEQVTSELIANDSGHGRLEVGGSNSIYIASIRVTNPELLTKQVNVFLRMVDANGELVWFRAVRKRIPGSSLGVEATVQRMFSESAGYEFNPIEIPPVRSITARLVFIVSNLKDGSTFTEALSTDYQAQFELRDPETGEQLLEFPLKRI
jgi:hypothetical protein